MKDLIRKILREDFDWTDEITSLPLNKDDHWFIFVDSLEEQREAEDYIHSRGYTVYGPEHENYCFYKDEDTNPLSALEHDPEEGRTLDNLYDGRYCTYEYAKKEYPNAKIYVWSKVRDVINESDLDWVGEVEPIVKNIRGLSYALKPKNLDIYNSKIGGGSHLKVLDDDGKYVKFQICCENGKYRDKIYYGRSSEIRGRMTGGIHESELDWVSNVGRDREQIMDDLETRIKTMDWDVDLERDHEWTTDEEGYFFGRFWCGEGLYELYEYGDTYTIRMYSREIYDGHHRYEHFNSIQDLSSKELMREVTRIIVNCLN
jgi:hypothetical protein